MDMIMTDDEKEVQVGDCILIFPLLTVGARPQSITDPTLLDFFGTKLLVHISTGEEPTDGNKGRAP